MRFLELSFPAFGPFTDFGLTFNPEAGLTVIYGPNESGKSSALRAVRGLLYGIPGDGRDEFLHPGDSLRLRALLQDAQGRKLPITRRKGRGKKTLLDEEGKPFETDVLSDYLQGVDEDLFDRLYGLDHRTLSLGGKALLEEGGKVGESLFAAGLGPGFRLVRDDLREEADKLWKPKSRTLGIDKAIEAYRLAQKRAADLSVSAESWRKISEALKEEEEKASALDVRIRQLDAESQRLRRHLDAHKPLVARAHLADELAALGQLPELSSDFSERRQHLQSTLAALRHSVERGKAAQESLRKRLAELPLEGRLLGHAARIDRLHRSLDAVAVAEAHQAPALARVEAIGRALKAAATDLGIELSSHKLPEASQRQRARRLAEAFRRLLDERSGLESQKSSLLEQLDVLRERREALGEGRDTRELEASLRRLRMSLGEDSDVSNLEKLLSAKSEALEAALRSLPLWTGDVAELAALGVPGAHHISDFERNEAELEERLRTDRGELKQIEERGKQAKTQLEILRERHKVATREDLREARGQRDKVWDEAVKAGWREEQQTRFERELSRVDDLTDRMLDDAARVTEADRLSREYKLCREEWPEQSKKVKERAAELEKLRQDWRGLWNSPRLSLGRPSEMLGWLPRREAVLAIEAEVRTLRVRLKEALERRAGHLRGQAELWAEFLGATGLGQSIGEAIERAEGALAPLSQVAEEQRQLTAQEESLKAQLAEARAGLSGTDSAMQAWREEWTEVAAAFHRSSEADPRDLEGLLERYEELRKLTEDHERAKRELQEHQLAIETFRLQVAELAEALGETVREDELAALIERLVAGLAEERRVALLRQQLTEELERATREWEETARGLAQRETEWTALLAEVGGVLESELSELERKVLRRRQIGERLKDLEETLRPLAAGQSMEEFALSLRDTDWDTVPGQIRDLSRQIETLEEERLGAWQRKGQLEQELRGFDGAEAAAVAAQEAAEAMAEGKAIVARYARLALAEAVLKREMERYRRENEGPLLRAASDWFVRLTRSAYSGLTTGVDPRTDAPRLEAVSSSGRQVPVEGLSDGTRDQLFMALRLATISQSQEKAEPMPLILDDVLVHFDTERAQATLEVLAEFAAGGSRSDGEASGTPRAQGGLNSRDTSRAGGTQVLLFTHLERDHALASSISSHPVSILTLDSLGL